MTTLPERQQTRRHAHEEQGESEQGVGGDKHLQPLVTNVDQQHQRHCLNLEDNNDAYLQGDDKRTI